MSGAAMLSLGLATGIFLAAASALRAYAVQGQIWMILTSLALYAIGNLVMVRVMRDSGMAVAISVSAFLVRAISAWRRSCTPFSPFSSKRARTSAANLPEAAAAIFWRIVG